MKTKKLIVGNWKMNKTPFEAGILALEIVAKAKGVNSKHCDIVVCPSFACLDRVGKAIKNSNVILGAQDLHFENSGAYTGEVSGSMLKDLGAKFVIVGHSERRQYFGECDVVVNKKAIAAVEAGLMPIICVGESKEEREEGREFEIIKKQVRAAIADEQSIADRLFLDKGSFVIAYEPVWAIGTGLTATAEQAEQMCKFIKGLAGKDVKVLYGGSMNGANARELLNMPSIDGGLIGGASLKTEEFIRIVNS